MFQTRSQGFSTRPVNGNEQSVILANEVESHSEVVKGWDFVVSSELSITCKDHPLKNLVKHLISMVFGPGVWHGWMMETELTQGEVNSVGISYPSFSPTTFLLNKSRRNQINRRQDFALFLLSHV